MMGRSDHRAAVTKDRMRSSLMVTIEHPPAMDRDWFTMKQAAQYLGTTVPTVRHWSDEQSIGKRRRGQHRIFNRLHMQKLWAVSRMVHDLDLTHHAIRRVMRRQWYGWAAVGSQAWVEDQDLILTTADEAAKDAQRALADHVVESRKPRPMRHE